MEKVDTVLVIVNTTYDISRYNEELISKNTLQVFNFPEDTYIVSTLDGHLAMRTKDINDILKYADVEIALTAEDLINSKIIYDNSIAMGFKVFFDTDNYVLYEIMVHKDIPEIICWFNNLKNKLSGGN